MQVQDFSQTIAIHFLTFLSKNKEISFEGYGDKLQSIWYNFENNEFTKTYPNIPI